MQTTINGQSVPSDVADGLCHQVVREYNAGSFDGYSWPGGTTTLGLPWFRAFREAVDYLEGKAYAGLIQTYLLTHDGKQRSNITAGQHYRKVAGDRGGPISSVRIELAPTHENVQPLHALLKGRTHVVFTPLKKGGDRQIVGTVPVQDFLAMMGSTDLGDEAERALQATTQAVNYDCPSIELIVAENKWWRAYA